MVLGERLQSGDAAQQFIDELLRLHQATGLPLRLSEAGVTRESLPELARSAMLQQRLLVNNRARSAKPMRWRSIPPRSKSSANSAPWQGALSIASNTSMLTIVKQRFTFPLPDA